MSDQRPNRDSMSDKEKELNIEHADWLLEARAKNQKLLLDLYKFGQKNSKALEPDPDRRSLFALLTGAAFSLWRAAFLSDTERSWGKTFNGVKYLLVTLIEDNAVPYSVDRKSQEWTGGYYLNNATFRLLWVRGNFQHLAPSTKDHPALIALDGLDKAGIELNTDSTKAWDILNDALGVMAGWLKVP